MANRATMTNAISGPLGATDQPLWLSSIFCGITTPAPSAATARIARRLDGFSQPSTPPSRAHHQAMTAGFSWNCVKRPIPMEG